MAAKREPRYNAGNRMSKVLAGELDDDDFYKTTYGGFAEDEEDNDFHSDVEDSADEVDSDFDQSEVDELKSDDEDADKPKPRKRGISTKAYKEPISKKTKPSEAKPSTSSSSHSKKQIQEGVDTPMRKSSRKATATNSLLTIMRQKEREDADKKKKEVGKKPAPGVRRLTQEELMKLAEKTERKNLKSLEKYRRLEANRKKVFVKKRTFDGPTVTYLSTVVPCFENLEKKSDDNKTADSFDASRMSRDYVIFSDDSTFDKTFTFKKKRVPSKSYCLVTHKPARYIDPLTKIPYYDMKAFKIIRKIYNEVVNVGT